MNILFVGGGRRVVLAKLFIERGWRVLAYEMSPNVPVAHVAPIIQGLQWDDKRIVTHLALVCNEERIDLILPLMDAAISVCAKLPNVAVASEENAICPDKKTFEEAVLKIAPEVYPKAVRGFPAVRKPRYGFGSKGILHGVMPELYGPSNEYVMQQEIIGKEYTVDAYFDRHKHYVDSVPRLRRIVADGEVKSSVTVELPVLQHWAKVIGEGIGLIGPVNMQFIIQNGKPWVTECNARFGGGWPLSIYAGLDAIRLLMRDWCHEAYNYIPNKWTRNLATERYFEEYTYLENNHR